MKKKKSLKYLVGGVSLAAELLFTSCSSPPVDNNKQAEIIVENESSISDANKDSSYIENKNESSTGNSDEFDEERKIFEESCSNSQTIYTEEFKSCESFSIDWNSAGKCYEIVVKNDNVSYDIELYESDLINFLIHQINCERLTISHDKDCKLLSSLTECHTIKSIVIEDCNISSLDGIENLSNLETLIINNCANITDLSPIKELTNIDTIMINGTKISDISVLSNLPKLSYVNLRCNEVTNPEVLESLENLNRLKLEFNKITDREQLKGLIEKGVLLESQVDAIVKSAETNRLKLFSENCENETYVIFITYMDSKEAYYFQLFNENQELVGCAMTNDVEDFSQLNDNLTNCRGLKLVNFPEDSSSFNIVHAENFDFMVIDHCDFSNLDFLDGYSGLTYLSITNCPNLVDVFNLPFHSSKLENLKTLSVIGTNIRDFDPLVSVSTLENIELKYNDITSFNFLTKLPNLKLALIGIDNYPVDAISLKEIQDNGVKVKVTGYYLPEPEEPEEDELETNQEQGKMLEFTYKN